MAPPDPLDSFRYTTTLPTAEEPLWCVTLVLPGAPGESPDPASYVGVDALNRLLRFSIGFLRGVDHARGLDPATFLAEGVPEVTLPETVHIPLRAEQVPLPDGSGYRLTIWTPARPRVRGHLRGRVAGKAVLSFAEHAIPDLRGAIPDLDGPPSAPGGLTPEA